MAANVRDGVRDRPRSVAGQNFIKIRSAASDEMRPDQTDNQTDKQTDSQQT